MKTIEINCRRERLKLFQNLNNEVTCKTDTDDFYRSISVVILSVFTLIITQMRNVAKKCFSANLPKVLIFGLLVRTGTINDFSC